MKLKYFTIDLNRSFTLDYLKQEWRKVAIQNHPDKGGNAEAFKIAIAEYEYLLTKVNANFTAEQDMPENYANWVSFLSNVSPCIKEWMEMFGTKVASLGAKIEVTGTWIWVSETKYEMKDTLKECGLKWASHKKMWFMNGSPWHGKSMPMESIRQNFGSTSFKNENKILELA